MAEPRGEHFRSPNERRIDWYESEIPDLSPETRDVLENYSHITPADIERHLKTIRDKAWAIHSYPCIGQWRFLDLGLGRHQLYPEILTRMRTGEQIYLDLGCAFAQDIRRLVADGVDSRQCYGSDLQLEFLELGYELFRDRSTLKTEFIAADVFDSESALKALEGKVDVVGASSFFHLFSWEDQKRVGLRVVRLLKPQKDSLVVGRQVGNQNAGEWVRSGGVGSRFRHNAESWEKMWQEIGDEAGCKFEVEVRKWDPPGKMLERENGGMAMEFSVRML